MQFRFFHSYSIWAVSPLPSPPTPTPLPHPPPSSLYLFAAAPVRSGRKRGGGGGDDVASSLLAPSPPNTPYPISPTDQHAAPRARCTAMQVLALVELRCGYWEGRGNLGIGSGIVYVLVSQQGSFG
jgi:hypothetical protein